MRFSLSMAPIIVAGVFLAPPIYAQNTPSPSVCEPLVAGGLLETRLNVVDDRSLEAAKSVICESTFDSYNKAINAHMGGSFELIGILKGSPDDKVNSSNFREKRRNFCNSDASDYAYSSYRNQSIQTVNVQLAKIFEDCVESVIGATNNSYAYLEPSSDLSSFVVRAIKSNGYADIDGFAAIPAPKSCSGGLLDASPQNPIRVIGSKEFICENSDPTRVVKVTGNFAGDGSMFVNSTMASEIPRRQNELDRIKIKLNALEKIAADGTTKKGMVAFFKGECPSPAWKEYKKLRGRYVVGVTDGGDLEGKQGKQLADLENRAVGKHTHRYSAPVSRGGDSGGSRFATYKGQQSNDKTTLSSGDVDGTNAPYIQLMACEKK